MVDQIVTISPVENYVPINETPVSFPCKVSAIRYFPPVAKTWQFISALYAGSKNGGKCCLCCPC